MKVWIVMGWFGDREWIEDVYIDRLQAEDRVTDLWKHRESAKGPEYCKGLHKFGLEEYEVVT